MLQQLTPLLGGDLLVSDLCEDVAPRVPGRLGTAGSSKIAAVAAMFCLVFLSSRLGVFCVVAGQVDSAPSYQSLCSCPSAVAVMEIFLVFVGSCLGLRSICSFPGGGAVACRPYPFLDQGGGV